jgi:hypothetical protein
VKRQREQARRERQAEKAAKRAQRKNEKAQGIDTPEDEVLVAETEVEPNQ